MLQSSGISQKSAALIVRYSQKKEWISFVFYCFENPSIAHNFGTTGQTQVGFSVKCTSSNKKVDFQNYPTGLTCLVERHCFTSYLRCIVRLTDDLTVLDKHLSPKWALQSNKKLNIMFDFRLISLDRITYYSAMLFHWHNNCIMLLYCLVYTF